MGPRRVLVILLLLCCTACGGEAPPLSFEGFVADLEATGADVVVGDTAYWSLFRTDGTDITVDGTELRIHRYPDESSRIATSDTIVMSNWAVNGTPVEFIATPHFWPGGTIIVQYLGDDRAVVELIDSILGAEVR